MDDTSHLVTHFMATGAEKRLEDYHFLRNTYETIAGQEAQLNRILRVLGEDEIFLDWYIDTTPVGRGRSRALYDFDRTGDTVVLPGSIAYQRLREKEQSDFKTRPPLNSASSYRPTSRERFNESTGSRDQSSRLNSNYSSNAHEVSNSRSPLECDGTSAQAIAKRQQPSSRHSHDSSSNQLEDDNDKFAEIELISFTVLYEDGPAIGQVSSDSDSLGRLLCDWKSPISSSNIDYYNIERQLGDGEWLPIGNKIDRTQNHTVLEISSLVSDVANQDLPSRFRLRAYRGDGKIFTSKPTDQIFISSIDEKDIIRPSVAILSPHSVQLTWKKDENGTVNVYDIEKKEEHQSEWEKVQQVLLSDGSACIDNLTDARGCHFRLIPSQSVQSENIQDDVEADVLTVHNVSEWLGSLHLLPTSSNTVDIDVSKDGFKDFDRYKVEYTTNDKPDQWEKLPDITRDTPHLTIGDLESNTNYKFRLTPLLDTAMAGNECNVSQLSLVLDVTTPASNKDLPLKDETKEEHPHMTTGFAVHQIDATSALIVAVVPTDKPALFEDGFDIYVKKEGSDESQWKKLGAINKDHLSLLVKDLEENAAYAFKIHNQAVPFSDDVDDVLQNFKCETSSEKKYDQNLVLEKFEESLEKVVSNVMRTAAGHQALDVPMNISLNEVIQQIFNDESLVPDEQYGFDTLALNDDLQLFRGPKQMMLQELDIDETKESSKEYGEIIIHNYRTKQHEKQPVIVREEQGNTSIGNIGGDIIVRNVVTDVELINEETRNRLSMNIVGQAFLKGFHGKLTASRFKGIIVVKTVNKS